MSSVPLKLKDSAAPVELQEMSTTEENYLAYQVGLSLAALDSSDVGRLGTDLSGSNHTVGFFTDTSYDSAVGTHSNLLTITSVDTTIRQKAGTLSISGNDYRIPVFQRDSDGQRIIQEMDDTKLTTLVDRINSRIYTSDYPGTYKLATSAPSGDYSVSLSNVTTDTRTDGHSLQYNIYQRNTMTAPTTVRPFAIKRSSGQTGTYQGLQEMTDDQIKYSFGLKARNRTSTANSVGSYKILPSSTGTPTDAGFAGTWQAKGTATDTRQSVSDISYTRNRSSTYSRLRTSTYSADYTRTRSSTFLRSSTTSRTSTYSATYTKTRTSNYSPAFVGDYIGNFTTGESGNYQRIRSSSIDYQRTTSASYIGDYTRLVAYTGDFTGNYVGGSSTGPSYSVSPKTYWVRMEIDDQNGEEDPYIIRVYWNGTKVYELETQNATVWNWTSVVGTDGKTYTRGSSQSGSGASETHQSGGTIFDTDYFSVTQGSTADYVGNYSRNFTRIINYQRTSSASFTGNYTSIATYTGDYVGDTTTESTRNSQRITSTNFSRDFIGDYARDFERNRLTYRTVSFYGAYQRFTTLTYNRTLNYSRSFEGEYQRTRTSTVKGLVVSYLGDYIGAYARNYSRTVGYSRYYTGNYNRTTTATYTGDFIGEYARNFYRTRSSNYTGAGTFTRDFAGNFVGDYARVFNAQYTGNYARNFGGNYIGNYGRSFIGDYARTFAGNYVGTTIGSGNTNIETYTMYVRVA